MTSSTLPLPDSTGRRHRSGDVLDPCTYLVWKSDGEEGQPQEIYQTRPMGSDVDLACQKQ